MSKAAEGGLPRVSGAGDQSGRRLARAGDESAGCDRLVVRLARYERHGRRGIHDLQGNNVHAYLDRDAINLPDTAGPDGGAPLSLDYAYAPSQTSTQYFAALAANAVYWGAKAPCRFASDFQ